MKEIKEKARKTHYVKKSECRIFFALLDVGRCVKSSKNLQQCTELDEYVTPGNYSVMLCSEPGLICCSATPDCCLRFRADRNERIVTHHCRENTYFSVCSD